MRERGNKKERERERDNATCLCTAGHAVGIAVLVEVGWAKNRFINYGSVFLITTHTRSLFCFDVHVLCWR